MAKFFTGGGDDGLTGILGSERLPKHHPRLETVGTLDEASAALGVARSLVQAPGLGTLLTQIQRDLYGIMAETAATPEEAGKFRVIDSSRVAWLELCIEQYGSQVQMPREFIVPGDTPAGGALDLARTVVRRAERRVSELAAGGELENPQLLVYLNRLSSLCFLLELFENQTSGKSTPTMAKAD